MVKHGTDYLHSRSVQWPKLKKNFRIKMIWVVLMMFPVILRNKNFLGPRPLPWLYLNPKIIFFSETAINKFAELFEWFHMILCFGNKKYFLYTWGQYWTQSEVKNILYFFWRFEFSKGKVWVFSGVLIFNFWSTMGLTMAGSQGRFRWTKLKNKISK